MINRKTWKLSERPDSYGKKRVRIHPPAKKWEDINEWNQLLFKDAAGWSRTRLGLDEKTKMFAYGSRVNGDFLLDSDIDIAYEVQISTEPGCEIKPGPLPKFILQYGGEEFVVDVKHVQPDPTIQYIEIPI